MPDEKFTFNGVGPNGQYLTAPVTLNQVLKLAQEEYQQTPKETEDLVAAISRKKKKALGFGDANLKSLTEAYWGVIFAEGENDLVKQAIEPLHQTSHPSNQARKMGNWARLFESASLHTVPEIGLSPVSRRTGCKKQAQEKLKRSPITCCLSVTQPRSLMSSSIKWVPNMP